MSNNISEFAVEDLVRGMHDLSDDIDVVDFVDEKYQMHWEDFCCLIRNLMPLITIGQSPLTKKVYSGFGKNNVFFIKQEIKEQPQE